MSDYERGSHTIHNIKYFFIWTTKNKSKIMTEPIRIRIRELIRQTCEAKGITIVWGCTGVNNVRILVSCPTNLAPSEIVQFMKGRSSHLIQNEHPELKKLYWGQHFWARGYFCATLGSVTRELIHEYLKN